MSFSYINKMVVRVAVALGILKVASLLKFSFIVGSQAAFFSASSIIMPMTGLFNFTLPTVLFLSNWFIAGLSGQAWLLYALHHIPGLFAAASWRFYNALVCVGIPLHCMLLFWIHPVGQGAMLYTLYWFIPIIFYYRSNRSLFARAVTSTFIAHAVGSVVWLYTVPMTASQWLALIPVVAVERLLCAAGMVVVYYALLGLRKAAIYRKSFYPLLRAYLS